VTGEQRVRVRVFSVGDSNEERFRCKKIFAFIGFRVLIQKIVLAFLSGLRFAILTSCRNWLITPASESPR